MARKKPSKPKAQPVFRRPIAEIALDLALAADEEADLPPPPDPNAPKKTVFEKTLEAMDPLELRTVLDELLAASLVPVEHLEPTVLKRLERMTRQWSWFVKNEKVPDDMAFHETTFVKHSRHFVRALLRFTKGSKANGLVAYGTLAQWCSTLIQVIGRHCVNDQGIRSGAKILREGLPGSREGGLFSQIIYQSRNLFREFQMDKRIPRKAPMGRYEAQRIIEESLSGNGSKEASVMLSLSVAIATVTALRPGSLGYSHPEWDGQEGRIGKFLKNKDLEIFRDRERGEGAFQVILTAEHIKGRNGDEPFKPIEFCLRSLAEPQNAPFDPVNYLLPILHHRGDLLDYVGKPYQAVLKGKEYKIKIGNPELPLFRQVSKGGYTMDPDPTKAMSAKSINARFSRCAESAGLKPKGGRGISFTGFRNCVASEAADLFGDSVASMLLAHQDVENTAKKYYLNGVSSYDMSGIIFGEITAGNKDHAKRALALNLFRRPALRLSMLEHMDRLAEGTETIANGDEVENEDGEDEATAVGSKRKRAAKAPPVSHITRGNLDSKEESAIVDQLVAELPEVKKLQAKADEAWSEFCGMTAQRPIRGNDWKRFLTWDEDEEIPADWNAAELPSTWGTAKARQLSCARYDKVNTELLALVKKQKRKIREERRKQRSLAVEKKKDEVSLAAAQAAEKALNEPSHLLHHLLPSLSTPATNNAAAANSAAPTETTPADPSASTETATAAEDDDAFDASNPTETIQVLEEDAECRFFLGVVAPGEESELSPMHSKIHNLLYSEDPPPNQDGSTSGLPQSSKAKESTKGKGSSKGKGKAKAAAAVEEVQWQDDRDENAKFNEAEPSPFDDRRKKELEKALKLAPAAEFRAGWQLFVADLMSSDKELAPRACPRCPGSTTTYCRAKLQRHLNSVHTTLDTHFGGITWDEFLQKARVGETDRYKCLLCKKKRTWDDPCQVLAHLNRHCTATKAQRPAKRIQKSLFSSTSSKSTDNSMKVDSPRRPLADFARGNTPASQPGPSQAEPSTSSRGMQSENRTRVLRPRGTTSYANAGISDAESGDSYVLSEVEEMEDDDWPGEEDGED